MGRQLKLSGTSWASGLKALFLQNSHSGVLFQITLTVIGRPEYYGAVARGADIRIIPVFK